jgi:hypothetical protein
MKLTFEEKNEIAIHNNDDILDKAVETIERIITARLQGLIDRLPKKKRFNRNGELVEDSAYKRGYNQYRAEVKAQIEREL